MEASKQKAWAYLHAPNASRLDCGFHGAGHGGLRGNGGVAGMSWNFDMTKAPRGETVTATRILKGKEVEFSRHVPQPIIAAGPSENFVGVSWWDPKREAWTFFSKDAPPIAWQAMPDHPNLENGPAV
jgi:hypothetical protein